MSAFKASVLFGIIEALAIPIFIYFFGKKKIVIALLVLAAKVFSYVKGIGALVKRDVFSITHCAGGYLCGFFATAVAIVIIGAVVRWLIKNGYIKTSYYKQIMERRR